MSARGGCARYSLSLGTGKSVAVSSGVNDAKNDATAIIEHPRQCSTVRAADLGVFGASSTERRSAWAPASGMDPFKWWMQCAKLTQTMAIAPKIAIHRRTAGVVTHSLGR